jgi:hypothetical protein
MSTKLTFGLLAWFLLTSCQMVKELPQVVSFEFKGIALGSPQYKIEHDIRFVCWDPKSPVADRLCKLQPRERETIAESRIKEMQLYFYDEKLQAILISFNEADFPQVEAALKEKYGPGTPHFEGVKNEFGNVIENRVRLWRRFNAVLEVKLYSINPGLSSARFVTDDASMIYEKRKATSAKEKAKDL